MNRALKKTISYRIVSSTIGTGITYLFVGSLREATLLTVAHVFSASIMFYYHEKFWEKRK